ncbi:MAG: PD-(D/E)XK motif protein, partial [Clostridia bacterium]
MYETIKEKFEESQYNSKYKRYDAIHPVDIYLGSNEIGNKSLVIIFEGQILEIESTKMIKVSITKREDKKLVLSFDLLENNIKDIFYKFCEDIIESTKNINKEEVLSFITKRWKSWISLFKNPISELLSEMEIRGLIGELLFLDMYMFNKYGYERSLNAWVGTDMSHKDFEIDDNWYEIKTVSQNSLTVKISSIEQLDSKIVGDLVIIKLEKSNKEVKTNVTLNQLVLLIKDKLSAELKIQFEQKLLKVNYLYNDD